MSLSNNTVVSLPCRVVSSRTDTMTLIHALLPGVQVILSIFLVTAILLQQRGAGLGGAFGDSTENSFYKRRGAELFMFRASIVLAVLFALSALLALVTA